jgi:hypothetical protein
MEQKLRYLVILCLPKRVTTIDDAVRTRHIPTAFACQVNRQTIQIIDISQSLLWRQVDPNLLLRIQRRYTIQSCVHISRADGVDSDTMLGPLSGKGLGELHHSGLGGVVAALLLWEVDDRPRHGGDVDDTAGCSVPDHVLSACLGYDESSGNVDVK